MTILLLAAEGLCRLLPSAAPIEIADYVARWTADWEASSGPYNQAQGSTATVSATVIIRVFDRREVGVSSPSVTA